MGIVERSADFLLLQFERRDLGLWPVAVLLYDAEAERLHIKVRDDLEEIGAEDAELLRLLLTQFASESDSGKELLERLEKTLSNSLRISDRTQISIDDVDGALDRLSSENFV